MREVNAVSDSPKHEADVVLTLRDGVLEAMVCRQDLTVELIDIVEDGPDVCHCEACDEPHIHSSPEEIEEGDEDEDES